MELSVVIPVYNEEENIPILYSELKAVLDKLKKSYEIIFVDDGSIDNTFDELKKIYEKDKNVKIIQFRKNYGKSAALTTGFSAAKGNFIITMDGDLQDDPKEILKFLQKINEGWDLIVGWKYKRRDPITKIIPSKIFNKLTAILTGVNIHDSNCGYKIFRKEVTRDLDIYGELHRYIPALVHWNGYKISEIKVEHKPRKFGKSKYGATRLLKGFFDLMTVMFLMKFGKRPLHFFGTIGITSITIGVLIGAYLAYLNLFYDVIIVRPALFLAIILIIVGLQLFSTGLLAEMIASSKQEDIKGKVRRYVYGKGVY